MEQYDVVVIGGGPAGLAAALSSNEMGAKTLIVEREARVGGILKQCIHDGFGIIKFKERLTGPEYAERYIKMVEENNISIVTSVFVVNIERNENNFIISLVSGSKGLYKVSSSSIVLANGCRERSSRQVFIHGDRPAGILTAGTAQYFVNIKGYLPCKKCVILGSGDIGLIMARRFVLEGGEVLGVYEAKPTPSGLTRNLVQCLKDYSIPLYLSKTINRIIGYDRVEAVEIISLDENMNPIAGTKEIIECDGVILSVGLIPENEIAEKLGVKMDGRTKGPYVDQNLMTSVEGVFSCGNALHVNDLVDYVSESGSIAGKSAASYVKNKEKRELNNICFKNEEFLYVVPQSFDITSQNKKIVLYFRTKDIRKNTIVQIKYNNKIIYMKKYRNLRPPEMERIEVDIDNIEQILGKDIEVIMQEGIK
ncbi:NAD(P)/FAD-dependent oxidoreductase [Clostridium sp. MSJ-11]|uniref:NAD(P)/FAD-dependent oxidoreductase n=1 Tax=Clostridium mobile TaxID=2841512 RepID=A0ABS6EI38_9CLOT|nr:FAD-dependent oxidoreductase [Clostridium mobile]MBU5484693.1 NAD(P)/FAD-dependent oxidoreductase [Clostridium mobile]